MDHREDIRQFLATRRARIAPERAGLSSYGGNRRVPGLRREEVALLAGVSVDYYTRLERGQLQGASDSVLEAVARALQLDEAEHAHLFDLARAAGRSARAARSRPSREVRPGIRLVVDAMTAAPAFVRDRCLNMCYANPLAKALYAPLFTDPEHPTNLARFRFLDPRAHELYPDWEESADNVVALLRTEAGRAPHDQALSDLIGELNTRSEPFRDRWAAAHVRLHHHGVKRFHHPALGPLSLNFESFDLPTDTGQTLTALSAEPATPGHDALQLLAAWVATPEPAAPENS